MAKISETELQRRLKSLEKKNGSSLKMYVSDIDPSGTEYEEGSEWYNSVTGNFYIFSGGAWVLTATKLHIRYATSVTNLNTAGIAASQGDIIGFSELPYTSAGVQKDFRGLWFGGNVASTDSTDYSWTNTAGEDGYSPIKGTDYDDGISGNNIRVEYSTDGITWVTTQVAGTTYLYIRTAQDTNNNGVYIAGIATKYVPEKGVEYDDGGTVAQLTVYKRSATALATPTGGQYNFGTNTLTTPTGWTSSIPTGTDPVYSSVTLANIIGNTGTDTTLTWSSPESILSNGVAGTSVYTTNVFIRSSINPSTPVSNTGSFAFGTNILTAPTGSPASEVWVTSIPTGSNPLYASEATFSISGDTGTDSTVSWGSPRIISQDGEIGLSGLSTYLFSVFQRAASLPATPTTGSYNFTTNTPTAPSGWSVSIPSGTNPLYVVTTLTSTSGPTGIDNTLTWSSPTIMAQDGYSPIKGTDYDDGISGNNVRVEYSTNNSTWVTTQATGTVYLYIRTAVDTNNNGVYVAGQSTKFVPELGIEYDNGVAGVNAYLHIKYSNNGTTFTGNGGEDVGDWLGTLVDSTLADSTTFSDYTFKEIVGADGYSPIKGTDYDDGIAGNNVRVEYSTDDITWVTNQVSNTTYLYIRTAVDTNNNGVYVAGQSTKFVPVKGVEYDDGDAGTDAYLHIKYSNNGTTFTANNGETVGSWIGTLSDSTLADSTTFSDYTFKEIVGADGYTPIKNTDYFDGTSSYLHIKYSNNGTTFTGNGGEDIGDWIGTLVDTNIADSTVFSDYTFQKVVGSTPTFERYYSTTPGLASEMGDPTTPGSGITWTVTTGSAPATAYWVAERYTLNGVTTSWQIYPVKAKDGGIPFVTYTKAGFNMPTLGDSTWITDAVAAVTSFTGRPYTNQKEFGYGTTVVITYNNGKLYGTYKRSGSSDTWVSPASFIDGDLIVDGTIAANHIQANAIDATKLVVTGLNSITATTVGADLSGAAAAAQAAAIASAQTKATLAQANAAVYADGIVTLEESRAILDATTKANAAEAAAKVASDPAGSASAAQTNAVTTAGTNATAATLATLQSTVYSAGTTTIDGGKLTANSITAGSIAAGAITAGSIVAGTITGWTISGNTITAGTGNTFSGKAFEVNTAGTVWADAIIGGVISSNNDNSPSNPALTGVTNQGHVAVFGAVDSTNSSTGAHGIRGTNYYATGGRVQTSGLIGAANGYDFYAEGAGTNYGPFTGAHDCLVANTTTVSLGDLVVDVACIARRGLSNTLFSVETSSSANQAAVLGVLVADNGALSDRQPAAFIDEITESGTTMTAAYTAAKNSYQLMAVNAVGEGQMNVIGEGGDLVAGDLIVSSSTAGKGMKQADNIVRSHTVAKVRESVTFTSPSEERQVACIYLCG